VRPSGDRIGPSWVLRPATRDPSDRESGFAGGPVGIGPHCSRALADDDDRAGRIANDVIRDGTQQRTLSRPRPRDPMTIALAC
jgi:hypothetical protein